MKKRFFAQLIALTLLNPTMAADQFDDEDDEFGDFYGDADFVSIATGVRKNIDKTPAIATVITAEEIKKAGYRSLSEALSFVPGLNVSRNGQFMAPKFQFRGITSTFSPQTLVLVNGTSIKSIVRGDIHTVWAQHPIHSIARIEIIRGPGSALYGADAFSGTINIITKGAEEGNLKGMGVSYGSFNTLNVWANGRLGDEQKGVGLSLEYVSSDGHEKVILADAQSMFDQAGQLQFGLPPVSLAPGPVNTGFEGVDIFLRGQFEQISFSVGLQDRSDVETGQGIAEALDPEGKFGHQKWLFDLSHEVELAEGRWQITSTVSYYRSEQSVEQDTLLFPRGALFGAFPDGLIGSPGWQEDGLSFSLKGVNTSIANHNLTFGAGYNRAYLFEVTESKNFLPDFAPRPQGVEDVSDTTEVFIPENSRSSGYLYVQDIVPLAPDWELTAGVRYDHYSDFGTTINPRLALVWSSGFQSTTKFLYGRAFRAPAFAELLTMNNPVALGNPDLSPEIIDTYELGYTVQHAQSGQSRVNLFYYKIEDFITFVPDAESLTATAQNVGKRSGYGIELEGKYSLADFVSLHANYSFVKAEDDVVNDDVGDYPNHQFKAHLYWDISDRWQANINAIVVGERLRTPFDPREGLSGYTDLGASLRFISLQGLEVMIGGRNLLDEAVYDPSPGPSYMGGVANIPFDIPQAGANLFVAVSKTF